MEPSINSAIRRGFFQQVRFLIEFGQSVNSRDDERRTPLMNCALIEDQHWGVGLARILIEKRAGMSYRDRRGMNALHYAALYDRCELVQVLLKSPDFDINQGDLLGNTALHYAVTKGHVGVTRLLVQAIVKYCLKIDKFNRRGISPLMQAWKSGHEECARILIHEGHADETLQEPLELKSAKEFEKELMKRRQESEVNELESPQLRRETRRVLHRRERPLSASFLSQSSLGSGGGRLKAGIRTIHDRPKSAITFSRHHRRQSAVKQSEPDLPVQVEINKQSGKLYSSADANDLRNKPEYVFNVSPVECFTSESQYQSAKKRQSLCSNGDSQQPPANSWKTELKEMYSTFDFQFTKSFCPTARATDLEDSEERSVSPHFSDSELSLEKVMKKTRGKISVKNAFTLPVEKPQRKGSGKSLQRKISSTSSLKSQQTSLDTSSCESVNSSVKNVKKRNVSQGSDVRDDASDISDKASKARSRKVSPGSTENELDQTMRGTSRGLPIPPIKAAVGQDTLRVISE